MWRWCLEGSNRIRLEPAQDPLRTESSARNLSPSRALFKAATGDPLFLHPEIVSELALLDGLGSWPLFILVGGVITFYWIRPTLQEMFLLKVARVKPLPELVLEEQTPIPNNLVLLGADITDTLETLRRRPDVGLIDCRDILRGVAVDYSRISQPVVAILHLDYHLDSADGNRQKLELLEGLLAQHPSKRVVVVAESDPVFHFGAASALGSRSLLESVTPGQEADRWARVFLSFTRMRLPAGSAMTPEQCRVVWSTCTAPERVALHQLARDQWANPKNEAALQQLQLRGLITGVPFQFADDSLQSFVHHAVGAKDRKTWELQDDASLWDGIRLMFLVLGLGAGAAVLFFNQQSVLGLVLTGISVMTPVTKLLSEAQSFRSLLGLSREAK